MQVHSIISNTISEEILASGHLSIRFMADGFSLLLEDRMYQPVVLNRFTNDTPMTRISHLMFCEDWLQRHTLLNGFKGEVSLMIDAMPSTLVPEDLFKEEDVSLYLQPVSRIRPGDQLKFKIIKGRPFYLVYSIPSEVLQFADKLAGKVRIVPPLQVLFSVADQVNASDHQRGFILLEAQKGSMGILIIREDHLHIGNYQLTGKPEEMIYHTLNTIQQLNFDRENRPLFYSGIPGNEELVILRKYIRELLPLPYSISDIEKSAINEHILLAEATRCE